MTEPEDSANRYWEGRWRDERAENERLRAALGHVVRIADENGMQDWKMTKIARKALSHEQVAQRKED